MTSGYWTRRRIRVFRIRSGWSFSSTRRRPSFETLYPASPEVAAALVVGASNEQQILADYTSMQTKIPSEFWADLKARNLIEQDAPTPN